jgi:GAF domain-containing protein
VLAEFARTLLTEYSVWDILDQLGERVTEVLPVDGAGVMLQDDQGMLRFASATDDRLAVIESLQIELGEGPCLLAYQTGVPVLAPDLSKDTPFPRFSPKAIEHGLHAVFAFPMRVRDECIGAINLYCGMPGLLDEEEVEAGTVLADAATAYVVNSRTLTQATTLAEQLQYALDARVIIEQAKGKLSGRLGIGASDAFELLRRVARNSHRPVRDVARDVMDEKLRLE